MTNSVKILVDILLRKENIMKPKLLKNLKRWSILKYFKTFNCYKNLSDIEKPIEIKLISSEGKEFRIDAKVAEYSQYVAKRLNDPKVERDGKVVFKLPNIETIVLQKIIKWCMQHSNITDEVDEENFDNFLKHESDSLIRKIFGASLFLEIKLLLDQTSQIISERIQKAIDMPKEDAKYVNKNGHFDCNEGFILKNRYKISGRIGKGTFGSVFKALDLENRTWVAIKIIKNSKGYKHLGKNEVRILQRLTAKSGFAPETTGIIHMLDNFEFKNHVCIVFDLLGKNLYQYMQENQFQPLPIDQVRRFAHQILKSIKSIHEMNLTHTDLKPENIVLDKNKNVKIIDFGSATFDHEFHFPLISTRNYRAPEVVLGLEWFSGSDIWSIGCIIYEMAFARVLFPSFYDCDREHLKAMEYVIGSMPMQMKIQSEKDLFDVKGHVRKNKNTEKISTQWVKPLNEVFEAKVNESVEYESWRDLKDLLTKMLKYDPNERITASKALKHEFFYTNL